MIRPTRSQDRGRIHCAKIGANTEQEIAADAIAHVARGWAVSPLSLRQADLPDTTIPWWGNRTLHFEYH